MRKSPKTSCDFRIANSVLSLLLVVALLLPAAFGQAKNSYQTTAGEFKRPVYVPLDRSEEDWSFLKDPELRTDLRKVAERIAAELTAKVSATQFQRGETAAYASQIETGD